MAIFPTLGALPTGERRERVIASSRFVDGKFRNTDPKAGPGLERGSVLRTTGEFFFGGAERRPKGALPLVRPHEAWATPDETGLRATWLGHSTVLLEVDGVRVLTDPVFGARTSPFSFMGPKRFHEVPATIEELPPIDAILVSHDHFDHLDYSSVLALAKHTGPRTPFVTSLGVGAHLEHFGIPAERIVELDWHESFTVPGHDLRFTAQPAQHFSGRGFGFGATSLWSSWVIAGPRHRVFFSGDTGLTDEFSEIGRAHGPFDLVMLEVGAFHPSWRTIHLGPENALVAHRMLGGGALLPVHWGTFDLALHAWDEPAETLIRGATEEGTRVLTPRLGEVFVPSRVAGPDPWWREVTHQARGT